MKNCFAEHAKLFPKEEMAALLAQVRAKGGDERAKLEVVREALTKAHADLQEVTDAILKTQPKAVDRSSEVELAKIAAAERKAEREAKAAEAERQAKQAEEAKAAEEAKQSASEAESIMARARRRMLGADPEILEAKPNVEDWLSKGEKSRLETLQSGMSNAETARRAREQAAAKPQKPAPTETVVDEPPQKDAPRFSRVSTRVPTAKPRGKNPVTVENPLLEHLQVGLDAFKDVPEAFDNAVKLLTSYVNWHPDPQLREPDARAEKFIDDVVQNLLWLHDQVPAEIRARSKQWYDGAHVLANKFAERHGITLAQASAVLAVNSPQTEWFTNVSRAERILDIWFNQQDFLWSAEMEKTAARILGKEQYADDLAEIKGKTLGELSGNSVQQAMWLRVFDESHNPRHFREVTPEGAFGGFVKTDKGNNAVTAWASFGHIAKSIEVLQDGGKENISRRLGLEHKVRNFYNNIFAPNDLTGDVTIDTHAVAAGLLRPLSGSSLEVGHNLGGGVSNALKGLSGTYGIYAEAYRRAAAARGLLPREMQSITWEAVRGLYTDVFKRSSNAKNVEQAWADYRAGKITEQDVRDKITEIAGGINEPNWFQSNRRPPTETWSSSYGGELSEFRVSRPAPGPAASGDQTGSGRSGARGTGAASLEEQRFQGEGNPNFSRFDRSSRQGLHIDDLRAQVNDKDAQKAADKAKAEQDLSGQGSMFARGPTFYSALSRAVDAAPTKAAPAAGWKSFIQGLANKGAIKQAEVEATGINDWLDLQGAKVGKEQVQQFLKDHGVKVEEVTLGGPAPSAALISAAHDFPGGRPTTPEGWQALSEKLERIAQRRQASGDDTAAKKFFTLAEEAGRLAEGVNPDTGSTGGMPKFASYQLPGGENYKELLLTLPSAKDTMAKAMADANMAWRETAELYGADSAEAKAAKAERDRVFKLRDAQPDNFQSSHFHQPNILAHIRFNERTDADGKRVLFIEEIQSDWAQKGKKEGFADPKTPKQVASMEDAKRAIQTAKEMKDINDSVYAVQEALGVATGDYASMHFSGSEPTTGRRWEDAWPKLTAAERARALNEYASRELDQGNTGTGKVPAAPFVGKTDAWVSLALKRMIRYASENGFDRIAWTTGAQQAARYDLSKQVDSILVWEAGNGRYHYEAKKDGRVVVSEQERTGIDAGKLADSIGKDLAKKATDDLAAGRRAEYSGADLKVGGEGMKAFYDKIIPNVANDVLKKLGGGKIALINMAKSPIQEGWTYKKNHAGTYDIIEPSGQLAEIVFTEADARNAVNEFSAGEMASFGSAGKTHSDRPGNQPGFDITPAMREKAMGGLPLFRQGAKQSGLTQTAFHSAIAKAFGPRAAERLVGNVIIPLADQSQLPAHVVPFVRSGDKIFGFYDPKTGKTYAVLSNLSEADIRGLVLHEVGVHYGMKELLGERYGEVMKQLETMHKLGIPAVREARAEAEKQAATPDQVAEETLAYLVTHRPEMPFVQRVIAWIKAQVFRLTGIGELTPNDLSMLARAAVLKAGASKPVFAPAFARQNLPKPFPQMSESAYIENLKGMIDDASEIRAKAIKEGNDAKAALYGRRIAEHRAELQMLREQQAKGFPLDTSGLNVPEPKFARQSASEAFKNAKGTFTEKLDAAKQAGLRSTANSIVDRIDQAFNPLGTLPEQADFLAKRGLAQGAIENADQYVKDMAAVIGKASDADSQAVYDYWTTQGGNPNLITDGVVRAEAVKVKQEIGRIGDQLVEYGLLSAESREQYRDAYLPRLYLKHLLSENDWKALGAGKKPSDMGYLKARKDIPAEIRKVILGEITDPGFLAGVAVAKPMRDMALLDWLGQISENDKWVLPGTVVPFTSTLTGKTTRATPFWLKEEAARLRKQARYYEPDNAAKAEAEAKAMDRAADDALESIQGEHSDYKQIPATARYGRLRGMFVRTEIYNDLMGINDFLPTDPGWFQNVFGYGGIGTRATQIWKGMKVAMNPPAQIRNFVSNAVMMQLGGVPLHLLPSRIFRSMSEIRTSGKYYQIGKKYGVGTSTFATQEVFRMKTELLDLEFKTRGMGAMGRLHRIAAVLMNKSSDIYQLSETVFKTAMIIDGMERQKMTEAQAVKYANDWLFDYSLVNKNVRYARNAPIGVPFLTYSIKVLPRLIEVAMKHPQRYLPWVGLFYGFPMMMAAMMGVDKDDWDKLKMAMPTWLQDKGHALILPYKDDNNRWQVLDLGYFMPWTSWTQLAGDLGSGEAGKAIQDTGIFGGPITDIITAIKTGKDPFSGRDIFNKGDPPERQAVSLMNYIWGMAMPPFLTDHGLVSPLGLLDTAYGGKAVQAATGTTNKWGEPRATAEQAMLYLGGINVYGINPEETRATNLQKMKRGIADVSQELRYKLQDRSLSAEQKKGLAEEYAGEVARRMAKMRDYAQKSAIAPTLH